MEPDNDFEVKEVIDEMILLNTGSYHFDLIKKRETDESEQEKEILNVFLDEICNVSIKKAKDETIFDNSEREEISSKKEKDESSFDKSEREEIKELKIVVEQMRREIKDLKQHKCLNTMKNSKTTSEREEIKISVKPPESKNKCHLCKETIANNEELMAHKKKQHEKVYL